jgi:hypothetical protein
MIREHGGVPFAVGEKNCADCIAGDCLFLDHMRSAVRTFPDDERRHVCRHRRRTEDQTDETCHCQRDFRFHNTLLFLPGILALAGLGWNASFFRPREKLC